MNRFYDENYLRKQLSKYANQRIKSIGSDGEYIRILFKEGYGTSLITGTVNTEVSVKTITYLKEVCRKEHLIKGEQILKARHQKDLVYYKQHYDLVIQEAKDCLKKAESQWDEMESLQKKAATLQQTALTLRLLILKEKKDLSEEATEKLLEEIEKNIYGSPILFNRHAPEIKGTDFFFDLVFPNDSQYVEAIYWDAVHAWGIIDDSKEINFKNAQDLLRYTERLPEISEEYWD